MKLNVFENIDALYSAFADFFVNCANDAIATNDKFSVALSGGSSPKKLYELLASAAYQKQIDWTKVYFFFGDERDVAQTHSDSNYLMAKNAFLDALNIKKNQIFAINTNLSPANAAIAYQQTIVDFFKGQPHFDLILLGLGDDAHTASIFPGTNLVFEKTALVKEVYLAEKDVYRISFTAPLINAAKNVSFFTFGANKAAAIKAVLEYPTDFSKYPAQLISPTNGQLQWFVDQAAVAELSK